MARGGGSKGDELVGGGGRNGIRNGGCFKKLEGRSRVDGDGTDGAWVDDEGKGVEGNRRVGFGWIFEAKMAGGRMEAAAVYGRPSVSTGFLMDRHRCFAAPPRGCSWDGAHVTPAHLTRGFKEDWPPYARGVVALCKVYISLI